PPRCSAPGRVPSRPWGAARDRFLRVPDPRFGCEAADYRPVGDLAGQFEDLGTARCQVDGYGALDGEVDLGVLEREEVALVRRRLSGEQCAYESDRLPEHADGVAPLYPVRIQT